MKNLKEVLHLHELWVDGDPSGVRADLSGAHLWHANLAGANLRDADLRCADLINADLWGANLENADLRYANLWGANLENADLRYANLSRAILADADLEGADLRRITLDHTSLVGANLKNAKITVFYLSRHRIHCTGYGYIWIGCEFHPISVWLEDYKQIGKRHGYSDAEIDEYYQIIKKIAEVENEKY